MKFTFGIITNNNTTLTNLVIDSIENQQIPEYEIIVIGSSDIHRNNTISIPFDETIYPGWITKKKNIITQNASYENIVYMHDYIVLDNNWYRGFLQNGNNFDIIVNKINNSDGTRFRDWVLNVDFVRGAKFTVRDYMQQPILSCPYEWITDNADISGLLHVAPDTYTLFLNYNDDGEKWQKYIYISGSYFVCKKHIMEEYPLNELLLHNQGEDVEWSQRVRIKYKFTFNKHSNVILLKHKSLSKSIVIDSNCI